MALKLLLLVAVIALVFWLLGARRRGGGGSAPRAGRSDTPGPTPILACAHCGVHLPQTDALTDPQGRVFCSAAHRAAGSR